MAKDYYRATEVFKKFLKDSNGKLTKLALAVAVNARTVHRIKNGERTNSGNARAIHKAAVKEGFSFEGSFESAFELCQQQDIQST